MLGQRVRSVVGHGLALVGPSQRVGEADPAGRFPPAPGRRAGSRPSAPSAPTRGSSAAGLPCWRAPCADSGCGSGCGVAHAPEDLARHRAGFVQGRRAGRPGQRRAEGAGRCRGGQGCRAAPRDRAAAAAEPVAMRLAGEQILEASCCGLMVPRRLSGRAERALHRPFVRARRNPLAPLRAPDRCRATIRSRPPRPAWTRCRR